MGIAFCILIGPAIVALIVATERRQIHALRYTSRMEHARRAQARKNRHAGC